jgi:integrase
MRKQSWPRIRPRGKSFIVDTRMMVDGVIVSGERSTFKTKGEAETYAQQARVKRDNDGKAGLAIPEKLRIEALESAALLEPFDVSLREAVDYFIKHARPAGGVKKLTTIKDEFLRAKEEANRRAEYLRVQRIVLGKFCAAFGERAANSVRPDEIGEWMQTQNWSRRTRRNYHQDLANFFGFALAKKYCAENPLRALDKPIAENPKPGIFTTEQAKALLASAQAKGGRMVPFVALGLFAGLRTEEILRLDWRSIDLTVGHIEIASDVSKTREIRYVTITKNLAAWLKLYRKEIGPVCPKAFRWHRSVLKEAAKIDRWPDNALRHSFGSYHYAQYDNVELTKAQMGHGEGTSQTFFTHYRALVKKGQAKAYWALVPE